MPSYILKQLSASCYDITLNRRKVGSVRKMGEQWMARIHPHEAVGRMTAKAAFEEAVAIANRVQLCGENDEAKAREELARRNARVAEQRDRIFSAYGVNVPLRKRKILI